MADGAVQLVVQGDDFGMCHAVNAGIVRAFTAGILTQATAMAPCPWFDEAMALTAEHAIPLGMHQTLTCEWDHLRWRPITTGASLFADDGSPHRTLLAAQQRVAVDDAVAELVAQHGRFTASGQPPGFLDVHMGIASLPVYDAVATVLGLPFLYPGIPASLPFTSIRHLSPRPADGKKGYLLHVLGTLEAGVHLLVCHPGVPGPELASLSRPGSEPFPWAEEYRASDLDVLCDPEVAAAVEANGVRLTTAVEAFAA